MNIKTRYFGDVEVDENKVITFDDGLIGFNDLKKYLFMESGDAANPVCYLQSIEDVDIIFSIIDVSRFIPDYAPSVSEEELESLGEIKDEDMLIYNTIVIPEKIEDMRVNLKAPIVINLKTLKAKQVISNDERYSVKYYIYNELKKQKEGK